MPRKARLAPGGWVYHAINRRIRIFGCDGDCRAFLQAMNDALKIVPMRILGWCLMPNHWHLVLWPNQVNRELEPKQAEQVRLSIERSRPCGQGQWLDQAVKSLNLSHPLRPPTRPKNLAGEEDSTTT
jgi:hypothetical protein